MNRDSLSRTKNNKHQKLMKKLLITVGTTEFDELLAAIDNPLFINLLSQYQFSLVVIQNGRGKYSFQYLNKEYLEKHFPSSSTSSPIRLEVLIQPFINDFGHYMRSFHCIIGHAGAGTLLDVISMINEKKTTISQRESLSTILLEYPYVMTINDTLQGNHQIELANALTHSKYFQLSYPRRIINDLQEIFQKGNIFLSMMNADAGYKEEEEEEEFPIFNPMNFKAFLEDTL